MATIDFSATNNNKTVNSNVLAPKFYYVAKIDG